MDALEQKIIDRIVARRDDIVRFADDIYRHAELGYKEFRTAGKFYEALSPLAEHTEEQLAVTGVKSYMNTAKKGNFSLALIGELDALRIPNHAFANPETGAAHCCGHHAQLAGVVGAAFALADPEILSAMDGQLVFFAVPAEEYGEVEFKKTLMEQGKIRYGGGKCELIRIGAFDDIDACLAHHIGDSGIELGSGSNNGFVSKVITHRGKAAHAAARPEAGVNALSAASIGLTALAYNRETFRDQDSVRVHPILTRGGDLVNVVPEEAVVETLVRGRTLEAFADAARKTDRCFKAGAYAVGARYRIETMPGYLPTVAQAFPEELIEGVRELTEKSVHIRDTGAHSAGSTDVGDVQQLLPVYTFHTGGMAGGAHQSDFAIVDEEEAYVLTAKIFAISAYRLLKDRAALAKRLKADYQPRLHSKEEYTAFMDQFNQVEES